MIDNQEIEDCDGLFLGKVSELWRYPVGSAGGETLRELNFDSTGVLGDRIFRILEKGHTKAVQGAHIFGFGGLLNAMTWVEQGQETDPGDYCVCIKLPDGTVFKASDEDASDRMSSYLGRAVELKPAASGLVEDAGSPNSKVQPHFPVEPVHIVTTSSLSTLSAFAPNSQIDTRRFRPNIVIQTPPDQGFVEFDWVGKRLKVGKAIMTVKEPVERCPMTSIAQMDLPRDVEIYKTIRSSADRHFGIYALPQSSGFVSVGDKISLIPNETDLTRENS